MVYCIKDLFGILVTECSCDKLRNAGEHLDYKNCKCGNKLIEKLVEEYSENIDGNEMIYNGTID